MKKSLFLLLILTLSFALVACTQNSAPAVTPEPAPTATATATPAPESEDESEPETTATPAPTASTSDTSSDVPSSSQGLPAIEGSEAFVALLTGNAIDTKYSDGITTAASTQESIESTNLATREWETQLNYTYTNLINTLSEDDKTQLELEQDAWRNELPIYLEQFQEETEELGSSGSLEYAYRVMLLYRERALALFTLEFENSGEIEIVDNSGEAVG